MSEENNPYFVSYGHALADRSWLIVAVAALAIGVAILAAFDWHVASILKTWRPVVYRVDQLGRTEAFHLDATMGTPGQREIQYYTGRFVQDYYGWQTVTMAQTTGEARYFLPGPLREQASHRWEQEAAPDSMISGIGVELVNVLPRALPTATSPGVVEVDFYKKVTSSGMTRRELWTAVLTFHYLDKLPNPSYLGVNPWGIEFSSIEDHEDFSAEVR